MALISFHMSYLNSKSENFIKKNGSNYTIKMLNFDFFFNF